MIGVLVEAVSLLSTERASQQTTLAETERRTSVPVPNPPPVDGESTETGAVESSDGERTGTDETTKPEEGMTVDDTPEEPTGASDG